ncbi:MAG: tRNA (N(6)-L-threonylcarbamoyladenosine(37)-C(2))-methylthiotransferase MtaB [Bacteroidales bacterium]|nr:tRNA (N(6)-L-threonylcarbamoyladenosine(37)-C(2))-methylthiotransferase MtaB [Bacteroidales bacterium]
MTDSEIFSDKKALFHTFGCKLNFSETSSVARQFAEKGIRRVSPGETPDIIVVNSCSVTEVADKKCRQYIRSMVRKYPGATVLVTGCYAQLKPQEVAQIKGVDIVAGNDRKLLLGEYLDRWIANRNAVNEVTPWREMNRFVPSCSRGDRTRYFLKVQDGCDYWCTYCTIPQARGRSRSASVAELVEQARKVAEEGGKEIVLTGVNIGDFGKGTDETFFDLVRALDEVEGIERYRISSIEPNLLTDEIIEFVAQSRRFMPSFHVPLQSGSDAVLKLMHRHYDTALFRRKMEKIRSTIPHAFIGVDLMVGVRGETPEEFENSRRFVESLPISRLHVFTYSERPGTKALEIPYVVDQAEKHRRTGVMLRVSEQKLLEFTRGFEGQTRPVLMEHPRRNRPMTGFTDNYIKVEVAGAVPEMDNRVVNVRLTETVNEGEEMRGEVCQ